MSGTDRAIRPGAEWKPQTPDGFTDVTYDTADGIAKITICRPEVRNAFRPRTLFELRDACEIARDDPTIGVIILTGEGPDAFCSGGDQRIRGDDGYRDDKGIGRLNVLDRPGGAGIALTGHHELLIPLLHAAVVARLPR